MDDFERQERTPQYWYNESLHLRVAAGVLSYCIDHDEEPAIAAAFERGGGVQRQDCSLVPTSPGGPANSSSCRASATSSRVPTRT